MVVLIPQSSFSTGEHATVLACKDFLSDFRSSQQFAAAVKLAVVAH
jgi:hypothetical protein